MKTLKKVEGFWNSIPHIVKISFAIRGKLQIELNDGRIVLVPLGKFPSIKKLSPKQRENWYIFGNGFSFEDSNEVYHIEQILGNYENYKHDMPNIKV